MNDLQKLTVVVVIMGLVYLVAVALHALGQIAYRWAADLIEDLFAGPAELGPEGSAALVAQVDQSEPSPLPAAAGPGFVPDSAPQIRANAPAVFIGRQWYAEFVPELRRNRAAHVELYNLTADIPGHPIHSTVSRKTLEAAGYRVPAVEPFNLQAEASRGLGLEVSRTGFVLQAGVPGVREFSN